MPFTWPTGPINGRATAACPASASAQQVRNWLGRCVGARSLAQQVATAQLVAHETCGGSLPIALGEPVSPPI